MVDLNIKLPDSFLLDEERDGYFVSAKTKELWAIQLDLLNEFDRVCKKYNLKYILDFGTLLGAIRHKGFIPWDDDLDVSMLREDYDKLMKIGPNEFKHPYFLQNQYTDKNYCDFNTKLRRSDTTFLISENVSKKYKSDYNMGVFIDIFVFDNVPSVDKGTIEEISKQNDRYVYRWFAIGHRPKWHLPMKSFLKTSMRYLFNRTFYGSVKKVYEHQERAAKRYADSGFVGTIMFVGITYCRPCAWFDKLIDVPFEGLSVPVPENYDEVLRERYGDYMVPVMGNSQHILLYFDADRTYKDVLSDKDLMKDLLAQKEANR